MMQRIEIKAEWDPEANVWIATSDDLPGLVTEAETVEALQRKLMVMIPDLLEAAAVAQTRMIHTASNAIIIEIQSNDAIPPPTSVLVKEGVRRVISEYGDVLRKLADE